MKQSKQHISSQAWVGVASILLGIVGLILLFPTSAQAANLTEAAIRLDRMTASVTDTDILVVLKPASAVTEDEIRISFAAGFGVDSTPSNITTTTSGIPATFQGESLTGVPSLGANASGVSGQQVDVAAGDLTPGTLYGFYITAGIDNPGSTGQHIHTITTLTSNAVQDTARVATRIISNDQVIITATVPPTFGFSLSANTASFTTDLDVGIINLASDVDVTVSTNANNGWITWLRSANAGLDSAVTSESIDTQGTVDGNCNTLTAGQDYYQLDVDIDTDSGVGTGTVTIDNEYDCSNVDGGGTFSTAFQELAISDGTTDGDIITLVAKVSFTAIKAAGTDYTDTWTIVGAANF